MKKQYKHIAVVAFIAILSIGFWWLFFSNVSAQLHFTTNPDAQIQIFPYLSEQTQVHTTPFIANFTIEIKTLPQCSTICGIRAQRMDTREILLSESLTFLGSTKQKATFEFKSQYKSSITPVQLNVSCKTEKTVLCPSNELTMREGALLFLQSTYTKQEDEFFGQKEEFESFFQKTSQIMEDTQYIYKIIQNTYLENITLLQTEGLKSVMDESIQAWNANDPREIKLPDTEKHIAQLDKAFNRIKQLQNVRNNYTTQVNRTIHTIQTLNSTILPIAPVTSNITNTTNTTNSTNNTPIIETNQTRIPIQTKPIIDSINSIITINNHLDKKTTQQQFIVDTRRLNNLTTQLKTEIEQHKFDLDYLHTKYNTSYPCNANITLAEQEICTLIQPKISQNTIKPLEFPERQLANPLILSKKQPICCLNGFCKTCSEQKRPPILFIHGHAFNKENSPEASMSWFATMQHALTDHGYANGGIITLDENQQTTMTKFSPVPLTFRASYYYITTLGLSSASLVVQKTERLENYALRLNELVQTAKRKTGSPTVTIVAHSMGGLVAREYLQIFGNNDISQVITINTPHQGISGKVLKSCPLLGAKKECEDMNEGSVFLKRLPNIITDVDFTVIRSIGCDMDTTTGDGVVTNKSGYLEGAKEYVIHGSCTDTFNTNLHGNVLNIDQYPETLDILREVLKP